MNCSLVFRNLCTTRSSTNFLLGCILFITGCAVSSNPQRKAVLRLQRGHVKEDTSFVYALPYEKGRSHLVVQGYFGSFSHKNSISIDFKMKKGTPVLAARDGVVVRLEEKNTKGKGRRSYRQYANLVIIEHNDHSRAGYWHLQHDGVLVNLGDTVKQGQLIALSGRTGYSSFPHLHFVVWSNTTSRRQVPTRFMTRKGPAYLRPFRRYKNR